MSEIKYKFGILTTIGNTYDNRKIVAVCSCGQHANLGRHASKYDQCEACGNEYFINRQHLDNRRFIMPHLNADRKDNRGFKVTRTNLSVSYVDGFLTVIKENLKRTIDYDIVDGTLTTWRNDVVEYDSKDGVRGLDYADKMFFNGLPQEEFLDFVSNEVTRDMYKIVKSMSNRVWNARRQVFKALIELSREENRWIQILSNAGVAEVNRFYQNSRYGRSDNVIDVTKTRPHEILKVPRFMMSYIREDVSIDRYTLQQLQGYFKVADHNKFKEIMSIVKDESNTKALANSIDTITQIHIDYDYTNLKKLALYIFRECRLTQGISSPQNASTYLKDYISMSRAMGLEYEKYPKSLKKAHDVVQMNYNMIKKETATNEQFVRALDKKSYQNLVFFDKKKKYLVQVPTTSEDLIKEGNQLSHCVASYVKDVISDKCKILFLRDVENPEKPLATIEVRGINIRQARGFGNRQLNKEEQEFVKEWAEEKGLYEAYY